MVKSKTPTKRKCACLQVHFGLVDSYPDFRANQRKIEDFTCKFQRQMAVKRPTRPRVKMIPVVVHVVYKTARENITDAQVKSQIHVLNKDFRARNADKTKVPSAFKPFVGDAFIKFELAKKDPRGKKTKGITRTKTGRSSFTHHDDSVKSGATGGIAPWNTKKYLNIWVCSLDGGLLGYAQFPGGPPKTDGVVILNAAFGTKGIATAPFNKGRTTTHEVGHYLNLSHIWGEGRLSSCTDTDWVADTPNQLDKHFGKPSFPQVSCGNAPHGDMFMNYMDYVDDSSMFMFTNGQVSRMAAALAGPRKTLGSYKKKAKKKK